MNDGSGTDFSINGALTIQSNNAAVLSGSIRYNAIEDRFEGLKNSINTYNNSRWTPMSLEVSSASSLGGVKVGNNLSITSSGVLNASAQSISRKFQKILIVSQQPDTGDYISINQAITQFFQYNAISGTFNGEIAGLDKTYYPDPDENNRYMILITPGIYEEMGSSIVLPPYVSLSGDKKEECIIKINSIVQIICNNSNHLSNFTLDISDSTTGITAISDNLANNVIIDNIAFKASTLSGDTIIINASNVANLLVNNCSSSIILANDVNNNITFMELSGVSGMLNNNDITIKSYIGIKRHLDIDTKSNLTVKNCSFILEEFNTTTSGHTNTVINCDNSSLDLQYSKFVCRGYDLEINTDTHYNKGITFSSNDPLSYVDLANVVFLHYEDESQYDKISIPTSGNTVFINSLFTGSIIKVENAINTINNFIFTVTDIFENGGNTIIQLKYSDILVDEIFISSGTDIRIKQLYTIQFFGCQVESINETLFFNILPSQINNLDNYRIQVSHTNLEGRDPNISNNILIFHYPQEINVGKEDCDFASIRMAINSITDSSQDKPYIVLVKPGRYQETGTINIPAYVSLKGETPNTVKIIFEGNNGSYPNNTALTVNTNVIIQDIRIEILGLLDGTSIVNELCCICSVNYAEGVGGGGLIIGNQISEDFVSYISGIELNNIEIEISQDVHIANKTGIHLFKTNYRSRNVNIINNTSTALTSQQNIVGLKQTLCTGNMSQLSILLDGNNNDVNAYGIYSDRSIINTHHPKITSKCNGALNVINYGYLSTNLLDTTGDNLDISAYTNIIYDGYIRTYDGESNYGLFTANNSTLFTLGSAIEGVNFSYNDSNNSVPNSFLKTVSSYAFTTLNSNITNLTALDNYGGSTSLNNNFSIGDNVGAINMSGNKNINVGLRVGTLNTSGSRNILMGIDTGTKMINGDENLMIGVDAGNNSLGDRNVFLGDAVANNIVNGNDNTMVGHHAGKDIINGDRNILLGGNVASSSTNMFDDIVIGYQSGINMNNANTNIIMGNNTAGDLSIGSNNLILGHNTARNITTSNENVIVGNLVGKDAVAIESSVLMGYNTAANFTNVLDNVFIGFEAGKGGTNAIGQKNVVIGARAGNSMITSNENVIIGAKAASRLTTGSKNIVIGSESQDNIYSSPASNLTSGSDNIIMGNDVGIGLTTGRKNLLIGNASGKRLDGTNDTIILGYSSGGNISGSADTDGKNIIIGNESALNITSGRAIIIGHGSGTKATGDDIMIIGNQAGRTVEGDRNTLIGNYAGGISDSTNYPIKGVDNVLIGTYAGYSLNTGSHNVIIGSGDNINGSSGFDITSGDGNMIMGYQAGRQLTTGDFNVLFGKNAGNKLNKSSRNVIIGNNAASNIQSDTSDDNLILGNDAGVSFINASSLLLIGQRAGYSGTSGQDNTYIGNDTGYENETGARNTLIGNKAGYKNKDSENTMIGVSAGEYSTTASQNTFIGHFAGRGKGAGVSDNNTGDQNTYIGYNTGSNTTTGYQNITMGYNAGKNIDTGSKNIMLGPNAGLNASVASKNIFIGTAENDILGVGMNTTGNFNTFIGVDTGINNTSGAENISIGSHAGKDNTTGNNNINIGDDAGKSITIGDNNINIGKQAGDTVVDGVRNIVIGSEAGNNMGSSINDNIIMGSRAGQNNAVDNSIFIGKDAGKLNASGVGNILIGPRAGSSMSQNNNNIMLGSNAGSSFNRTEDTLGENIYIGPEAGSQNETGIQNIIIGTEAFSRSTQGSGVIAIGYQAGNNAGVLSDNLGDLYQNTIIGFQAGSGGDMNINNVIIGSKTGKNIDNARKFEGNLLLGSDAGKNANLAVNSIVIGSANKVGTGGDTNIIMGSSAGENVGNPKVPITKPLTTTAIVHNTTNLSVIVDMPLSTALYYFQEGDNILIEDADDSNSFETGIASIIPDYTATPPESKSKLIFTSAYANTIGSIDAGASIFSLSKISDDVGNIDTSKSSANTLFGTNTGSSVTTGSKNVAMGSQAMINNKAGKYNNVLGTQAGYFLKSDNNTCFGTRAGYSLDQYTNTNNTTATDMTFTANTNTISSIGQNLSVYEFGTVFEVEGSSKNDGRYIVNSSTVNTVIVDGLPKIEELGVPISVDADAIRINSTNFNYIDIEFSGDNISTGFFIYTVSDMFSTTDIYTSGLFATSGDNSNLNLLDNALLYKISGSLYNDGVYYIKSNSSRVIGPNSNVFVNSLSYIYPESFDENVTISCRSITSDTINSGIDFNDFTLNSSFYIFFGGNKGVYSINGNDTSRLYARRYNNNTALINESITPILNDSNVVFTLGLKQDIAFNGLSDNAETYAITKQHRIVTNISFFSSNNNIVFEHATNTGSLTTGSDGYFHITGTFNNGNTILNNNNIIKINSLDITGKILSIDSSTPIVDDQINCSDFSNTVIFNYNHIRKLNADVSTKFTSGTLLNLDYSKIYDGVVDGGTYLVEDSISEGSDNFIMLSGNQVIPKLFFENTLTNMLSAQPNKLRINKELYAVDTDYLADKNAHIHGYQLFFQTGNITPESGNDFIMHNANHHITSDTRYQFTQLVAPCMIKIDSEYYLVKENKYPFKKLIIDSTFNSFGGDNTTDLLEFNSVSSRNSNNCNLAVMIAGTEYTIFGGNNNHLNTITPLTNAISDMSVYVSGTINNYKSNGKMFNISTKSDDNIFDTTMGTGYVNGYFKHIELLNRDISSYTVNMASANVAITFNDGTMALDTAKRLRQKDILKITDNNDSNKYGLFDIYDIDIASNIIIVNYNGIAFPNFSNDINIVTNIFRLRDKNYEMNRDIEYDFDFLSILSGEHKNFLRFNKIQSRAGLISYPDVQEITKSLNFTVDADYYNNIDSNPLITSNISVSNTAIYLKEVVPDESHYIDRYDSYDVPDDNLASKYSICLGTPTLDSNNDIEKDKININTLPIGFIDNYIYDSAGGLMGESTYNTGTTLINITDEDRAINCTFNYFNANSTISITNYSINNTLSSNQYILNQKTNSGIVYNPLEPFQYPLRNGMFIDVYVSNASAGVLFNNTLRVLNIENKTTIQLDPTFNNPSDLNVVLDDAGVMGTMFYINMCDTARNQGQVVSDRYDFANFSNASIISYDYATNYDKNQLYWGISKLSVNNIDSGPTPDGGTNIIYYDDGLIPDGGIHNLLSGVLPDDDNPLNVLEYKYFMNSSPYNDMSDRGEHLWIIPSSNLSISSNGTNIFFDASDNSINSSDTTTTDLSVYKPGQKIIVTNTILNNDVFTISDNKITTSSKIIVQEIVNTESPLFCKIEKCILHDEISIFTDTDNTTDFINSSDSITTSNSNVDFFDFVPNQTIIISDTSNNNNTFTIANIIPTQSTLVLAVSPINEVGTNPTISKQIRLIKLGEAVTTITVEGIVKYHYTDAQGNNMMLGSFTGQFAGANGLSIHNTYIGNKVGQTNQGSGNILIGNETGFATDFTQGSSTYNNKFAIYKNNFIGVPSKPLLGGDFASGRVGINTINPDALLSGTLESGTRLVVNGAIRASAHNTFTGTHIIHLEDKIVPNIQPGMIVRSTGQVEIMGVIDTIVSCELTHNPNDKRVYGVYCHSDNISYEKENENTKALQKIKQTLHYCASVGEGCILVSTVNGELTNGDYVSSSPISGYGQLQEDDILHSYTVAKITEDIDWSIVNSTHTYKGNKYKYALAGCSYHCG